MILLLPMGKILRGDECCPTANKDPSPASEAHKLQLVEINYSNANGLSMIFSASCLSARCRVIHLRIFRVGKQQQSIYN